MELDPKAKALLTAIMAAGDPPVQDMSAAQARELVHSRYEQIKLPLKKVASIDEITIGGPGGPLTLRIYTPEGQGPFPVILFIHGGGWVLFRPGHYDSVCTHLCHGASMLVVSVDYRLSPETKFPGALEDTSAALDWIMTGSAELKGDPSKVFIAGDSAGGNLTASLALLNKRNQSHRLLGLVMAYPVTKWYEPPTPSYLEFSDGYSLTEKAMVWFWDYYLESRDQAENELVSPLLSEDLSGLPPSFVLVSGFDPLRDEGIRFAQKLRAAGNRTTLVNYTGMIHGFLSYLGILDQASEAITMICQWLRKTAFSS